MANHRGFKLSITINLALITLKSILCYKYKCILLLEQTFIETWLFCGKKHLCFWLQFWIEDLSDVVVVVFFFFSFSFLPIYGCLISTQMPPPYLLHQREKINSLHNKFFWIFGDVLYARRKTERNVSNVHKDQKWYNPVKTNVWLQHNGPKLML